MPRLAVLAAAALLAPALTACTGPRVCPAIGWSNQLRVHLAGDIAAVDRVSFCAGAECTPPPPTSPATPMPGFDGSATRAGDVWTLQLGMTTPRSGRLAAYDSDGAQLLERRVALSWKRVGGTAACGGPERADASLTVTATSTMPTAPSTPTAP